MVPAEDLGWSDVGSWDAWAENAPEELRDSKGNVTVGAVKLLDSENCSVHSKKKLVAGIGLKDLVIVDTDDALLILPASRSQDVKKVIKELEDEGSKDLL